MLKLNLNKLTNHRRDEKKFHNNYLIKWIIITNIFLGNKNQKKKN